MNISTSTIEWAENILKKYEIIAIKNIVNTDYSFVSEIQCKNTSFFLKQNNSIFNYEDKLLSYLYRNNTNSLKIYAQNQDLNCFITQNSGVQISDNVLEHYTKIADKFIEIQIKSKLIDLIELGVRRFSHNEILDLCCKYQINSEKLLKSWDEIEKIMPLSLEHGDFHLGNILLDNKNNITFIDIAEGTITNPFFSLLAFENTLKWRGNLEEVTISKARDYWIKRYSEKIQIDNAIIEKMYSLSKTIFPLYCMFGLDILLKTCSNEQFKEKINLKIFKHKQSILVM